MIILPNSGEIWMSVEFLFRVHSVINSAEPDQRSDSALFANVEY